MVILTLKDLIRESDRVSFKRTGILAANIFEVFDLENNTVFTHYNDLQFLIDFQNNLISRGFIPNQDFYFESLPSTLRLNLMSGNTMVEYNEFHDLYFFEKPQPPPLDGLIKYIRAFNLITYLLTSSSLNQNLISQIINFQTNTLTSTIKFYDLDSNINFSFQTSLLNFSQQIINPEVTIAITH